MFFKTCAVLALATGFAAAKPVNTPQAVEVPVQRRSPGVTTVKRDIFGNNVGSSPFDFIQNFNQVSNQQQVVQVQAQEQTIQVVNNGQQQVVVEQAKQVLVVDQQNNGFNNNLKDIFRKTNARKNNNGVSTVMLVVQEIQVAVDDGQGNTVQQQVFAQSAVVANRGQQVTQTVMMFAAETIIAQNVLGQQNNNGFGIGAAGGANATALPTKTNDVQLLGAKPTWSSVAEDPAATVGDIWAAEIQDQQNAANAGADAQINADAAAAVASALGSAAPAAPAAPAKYI